MTSAITGFTFPGLMEEPACLDGKVISVNPARGPDDIRLMSSGPRAGLTEITLPSRQAGSSIMPGKVNPVMAEVINQIAFQVYGNDHTVSMSSDSGQFELNVMEPVLVYNLKESIKRSEERR